MGTACAPIDYGNILFPVDWKMDESRNKDVKVGCYHSDYGFFRFNSFHDTGFIDSNVNQEIAAPHDCHLGVF